MPGVSTYPLAHYHRINRENIPLRHDSGKLVCNCHFSAQIDGFILRLQHFQVEKDDKTTKICGKCFRKIDNFARYRDMCAVADKELRKSKRCHDEIISAAIDGARNIEMGNIGERPSSGDPAITCISLLHEVTDFEDDEVDAGARIEIQIAPHVQSQFTGDSAKTISQGFAHMDQFER